MRESAPVRHPQPSDSPAPKPCKARGSGVGGPHAPQPMHGSGSHHGDLAVGLDDGRAVRGTLHRVR